MTTRTDSTIVRLQLARENEDLVVAEATLQADRIVAMARIALVLLFAFSQNIAPRLLGGQVHPADPLRTVVGGLFLAWSVGVLVMVLRTTKTSVQGALRIPLTLMAVDYTFFIFMGLRSYFVESRAYPEVSAIAYAVLLCFSFGQYRPAHAVYSTALSCLGFLLVTTYNRTIEPGSAAFVCVGYLALAALVVRTNQRLREDFVQLRRRDNLTRFLSPQVAERVMKLGDTSLAPAQREVTVMFTDIRDFTSLSELMPPGEVLAFLDEYLGHMSALVKAHEGVVNKFLGDGMLALWGAPAEQPLHAQLAVRAALDMRTTLVELNQVRAQAGKTAIRFGVGIHSGPVAAGMLGGAELAEYTVIGDAVNLASRIEALTKRVGVDILVSEATWRELAEEFIGRRVGEEYVPGRAEPVVVYAIESRRQKPQTQVA